MLITLKDDITKHLPTKDKDSGEFDLQANGGPYKLKIVRQNAEVYRLMLWKPNPEGIENPFWTKGDVRPENIMDIVSERIMFGGKIP